VRFLLAIVALVLVGSTPAHSGVTACTKSETRSALVSFVRAFNAGDYRRLNRLFAGPSWFRWYSSSTPGVRFNPQAQERGTLISYFGSRHAQSDRFKLVSFHFTGNSNGFGNFAWKTERSAADFRDGASFVTEAKGAVLCRGADARFIVMSIGSPES
jgi:hypothetical protein